MVVLLVLGLFFLLLLFFSYLLSRFFFFPFAHSFLFAASVSLSHSLFLILIDELEHERASLQAKLEAANKRHNREIEATLDRAQDSALADNQVGRPIE